MNKKICLIIFLAVAVTYIAYDPPFSSGYETQSAQKKQDFIWAKALADKGVPSSFTSQIQLAPQVAPILLGGQDFAPVGHNESDQNAHGRVKLIHSVSKSAKVKFLWNANPFTGAFSEEKSIGIMRASSAQEPKKNATAPGMGIKIFRDKVASGNFVAMWSLFGQNDANFFKHPFSNHVSDLPTFKLDPNWLPLKVLSSKFKGFDNNINMVGLSDLAKYKNNGQAVANPKAPFALVFKPNPKLTKMCTGVLLEGQNFGCLKDIAKGTLLYTIYYVAEPTDKRSVTMNSLKKLGVMMSDSKFISSKFMDEVVQFKHVFWADEVKALNKQSWNNKISDTFAREDGAEKWEEILAKME